MCFPLFLHFLKGVPAQVWGHYECLRFMSAFNILLRGFCSCGFGRGRKLVARILKSEPLILKSKPLIFYLLQTPPRNVQKRRSASVKKRNVVFFVAVKVCNGDNVSRYLMVCIRVSPQGEFAAGAEVERGGAEPQCLEHAAHRWEGDDAFAALELGDLRLLYAYFLA